MGIGRIEGSVDGKRGAAEVVVCGLMEERSLEGRSNFLSLHIFEHSCG